MSHPFGIMRGMKLSGWARQVGVHPRTAYRWFHAGRLPVAARQLGTGTILVDPPARDAGEVAVYARVSSADQRADLDRQVARVAEHATTAGLTPSRVVAEVGSALNGKRPKLRRLLADPEVSTVVVEHRDRLARFGVEYVEAALAAHGRDLVVLDDGEVADDLVRDMVEVLTSMCARLYGRRSARRRAQRAVAAAGEASA